MTGKEYYDSVVSGEDANHYELHGEYPGPLPDYVNYKDDDKGRWYHPDCEQGNWPDTDDQAGYDKFFLQYFKDHSYNRRQEKFFPATPPAEPSDVSPELLREIAIKSLTPPDPELNWNPKIKGSDATLVNFETWFWLDNPQPPTLSVRAEALGSWASVTATFGGMDITAPGEEMRHCPGSGTAYVTGRTTDCYLAFSRSSVAVGAEKTPVTVKTKWTATWTAQGRTPEPIMFAKDPDATQDIRVDEIQTVVTSAG